jgi:pilus assembly protein CpaC
MWTQILKIGLIALLLTSRGWAEDALPPAPQEAPAAEAPASTEAPAAAAAEAVPTVPPASAEDTVVNASPFAEVAREQEAEAKKKPARPRKFLNLTLGVEYDEKLPTIPSFVTFKGDFKKVTQVSLAKDIKTLRFTPSREGVATLTLHDAKGRAVAEYRIEVRKSKLDTIMREMQGLLGDIEGIQTKIINNRVVVDGQVLLPRDMNRIYNVVAQYGDQATSLVTLSPLAQKKIAEFIARDINNPEIEVRAVNDKFILQGFANSEDEKARAIVIAKMYVPPVILDKAEQEGVVKKPKPANDGIVDLISVKPSQPAPPGKIIQLVIHYVELNKTYLKSFRFQFMPGLRDGSQLTFSTGDNGGGASTTLTGIIDNLLPKLNWAKEHGYGRVLESSSLIVQDGKKGVLNSFQDVPFQTAQGTQGTPVTSFKKVGMQSAITPVIFGERSDSINLTIEFEISSLIGNTASGPLTSNNQMQTDIVVRSGQSAAVGGLITNRSSTDFNRLPANSAPQNPIISLLASRQFQRDQSQFVVFITPIIKSSASAGSEKIKKKFRLRD